MEDESFSDRVTGQGSRHLLTFVFVGFSFDTKNGHYHDDDHN